MSDEKSQNLKNHAKVDPTYHYLGSALLLLCFVLALIELFSSLRSHPDLTLLAVWALAFSVLGFVVFFKMRLYPLKVQDRVICLEERLRMGDLAPEESKILFTRLSEDQLIGLRFAPDDEVVALAHQALSENLNRKQIKERIKNWRADFYRI